MTVYRVMRKVSYLMPYLPLMIALLNFGVNIADLFFSKHNANYTWYKSTDEKDSEEIEISH